MNFNAKAAEIVSVTKAGTKGFLHKAFRLLFYSPLTGLIGTILGLLVGARMYETGNTVKIGRDLKGSTVYVSGPCLTNGKYRVPALTEDEVKITGYDKDGNVIGVIRKTREVVSCNKLITVFDSLPLLNKITQSPVVPPDIELQKNDSQPSAIDMEIKGLAKKTIKASGVCVSSQGDEMPAFIDKYLDVVNVEKDGEEKYIISAVQREDNRTIRCSSSSLKYSVVDKVPELQKVESPSLPSRRTDFRDQIILVTSTCYPNKRVPQTKRTNAMFFNLTNAKVQVIENRFDEEKNEMAYLSGALIDMDSDSPVNGIMIECERDKFPIRFKEFDSTKMQLTKIKTSKTDSLDQLEQQNPPANQESTKNKRGEK